MVIRRKTPEDDPERLAERVYRFSKGKIIDRATFNLWWREYMGDDTTGNQRNLKENTFKALARKKGFTKQNIFKQAGGKNLRQDQRTRARIVTRDPKKYIKMGAQKADLYGLDTPNAGPRKTRFTLIGRSRKKVVYARKTYVQIKGVKVVRHRDKRGRFVSIKKK